MYDLTAVSILPRNVAISKSVHTNFSLQHIGDLFNWKESQTKKTGIKCKNLR